MCVGFRWKRASHIIRIHGPAGPACPNASKLLDSPKFSPWIFDKHLYCCTGNEWHTLCKCVMPSFVLRTCSLLKRVLTTPYLNCSANVTTTARWSNGLRRLLPIRFAWEITEDAAQITTKRTRLRRRLHLAGVVHGYCRQ